MFSTNSFLLDLKESLIVPNRKFLVWKGFMQDGHWMIALVGPEKKGQVGWIKVQSKFWTLITRQIDGQYPDWRAPIPTSGDKSTIRITEEAASFITMAAPRLPGASDINAPVGLVTTKEGSVLLQGKTHEHQASLPLTGATADGPRVLMNASPSPFQKGRGPGERFFNYIDTALRRSNAPAEFTVQK